MFGENFITHANTLRTFQKEDKPTNYNFFLFAFWQIRNVL